MAFEPKKIYGSDFNGGIKYSLTDGFSPDDFNNIIEGLLYAQENGGSDQELVDQVNQNKTDIDFLKTDNARQQTDISGNTDSISAIIGNYNGILDEAVFKGVTNSSINLSDDDKTSACEWLGALEKVETTITNRNKLRTYVITYEGKQAIEEITNTASGNTIARYDGGGRLSTLTATSDNHCVNKKFVEDLFATLNQQSAKMYLHKITINNSTTYPWGDVYFNIRTSYPNEYTNDTFFTEKVYKSMLGTPYVAYADYDGGVGDKTYSSGTFYKSESDWLEQGMAMYIGMLSYTGGTSILQIDGHHTLTDEVIEL